MFGTEEVIVKRKKKKDYGTEEVIEEEVNCSEVIEKREKYATKEVIEKVRYVGK